ncbi:protein kinase family protein [Parendozoicomonas haliclonae]|uniref:protein kinase family protein n=1 Tax=Parendozoicomonas haliclonae TaxID=1960125 RepID=UPI0013FD7D64|nr:protein kinase family protein [Parendozoicomonas haliclonae]
MSVPLTTGGAIGWTQDDASDRSSQTFSDHTVSITSSSSYLSITPAPVECHYLCEELKDSVTSIEKLVSDFEGYLQTAKQNQWYQSGRMLMFDASFGLQTVDGAGAQALVARVQSTLPFHPVVLKIERKSQRALPEGAVSKAHYECSNESQQLTEIQQAGGHRNIITLYAAGVWDERTWMLLEPGKKDLFTLLSKTKLRTVDQSLAIAGDLINGLRYLHNANKVHRDIKTENVIQVVNQEETIWKLLDFGSCCTLDQLPDWPFDAGSPEYLAPECNYAFIPFDSRQAFSKASDIWSLGLIFMDLAGMMENPHLYPYFKSYNQVFKHESVASLLETHKQNVFGGAPVSEWCQRITGHTFESFMDKPIVLTAFQPHSWDWAIQLRLVGLACIRTNPQYRPKIEDLGKWLAQARMRLNREQSRDHNTGCCNIL